MKMRAGTLANFMPKASKIISVGHSHGAVEGNALATYHPEDADALILTGFSTGLVPFLPRLVSTFPLPALLLNPQKYHTLQDLLYLTLPTVGSRCTFFYTSHALGDCDESFLQHDFDTEDAIPLMQVIAVAYGYGVAPNFTGPVMAMAGERDGVFCNDIPNPDCGKGGDSKVARTRCVRSTVLKRRRHNHGLLSVWANVKAAAFEYHIADRTAHSLNYFHSAQNSFKVAHDFLAQRGF